MSVKSLLVLIVAWLAVSSTVSAQSEIDRVQRRNGMESGSVTETTPLGVTISKGGVLSKIPAEQIRSIQFAGEPVELNSIRNQFQRGQFDKAAARLKAIKRADITRPEIVQEYDFLTTASLANLALADKADLRSAAKATEQFLAAHRSSFHVPEMIELHGDLFQMAGEIEQARKKYETLAKAPAAYYKTRSAFLVGRLLQQESKHAEAIAQFDAAIAAAGMSPVIEEVKRAATLARAVSLAATGRLADGLAIVKQAIQRADAGDTTALAQGYNAMGECHLAAGNTRSAREAFLHVDLLFSAASAEHAEALYRLTSIWKELRQPTRAQEAQQRLGDDYPLSRWCGR